MKSQLTPEAELDLIEAIRWYDEREQVTIDCLWRLKESTLGMDDLCGTVSVE